MADLAKLLQRLETVTNRLEALSAQNPTENADAKTSASLLAFDNVVSVNLAPFLSCGAAIGGVVAEQTALFGIAVDQLRGIVEAASQSTKPSGQKLSEIVKPLQDSIVALTLLKDANRASMFFNHLSTLADGVPALAWVMVEPAPGAFVSELRDSAQFYANKVTKEWRDKDKQHSVWVAHLLAFLLDLGVYVKKHHTTGLVWNAKGSAANTSVNTTNATNTTSTAANTSVNTTANTTNAAVSLPAAKAVAGNLFSELSGKDAVSAGLRKVDKSEMTHKNPELRTAAVVKARDPAPEKTVAALKGPAKLSLEGNKWVVEYQNNNNNIVIAETEIRHVVYIYGCQNSTITIKGKVNAITLDSCKKVALLVDTVVSSLDAVNCKSVQIQITGTAPTALIDKTDGYQLYLSQSAKSIEIFSAKSSEMNILVVQPNGEYIEKPVSEQFKTTVDANGNLKTEPVEHKE